MINSVIVDDEPYCCTVLATLLKKYCPQVQLQATCTSAEEGVKSIKTLHPDLVFLDIEMPGKNGFQMLEELQQVNFNIIITTSYDQYALKAFSFSAIDYLLKPIDKNELMRAVNKVAIGSSLQIKRQLEILLDKIRHPENTVSKIALPTMDGLEILSVDQIVSCSADSNYTIIKLKGAKKITLSKNLKELEEMLGMQGFLRVHNSHLINLNEISRYVKGEGGYVIMSDGSAIDVSRSRKESLMKRLVQSRSV